MSFPSQLRASELAAQGALRLDALRALEALDPSGRNGFVERVLTTYLRSVGAQLEGLQAARQAGDLLTTVRLVHSLKSSSAYLGADGFATFCAEVEEHFRVHETALPGTALSEPALLRELDDVVAMAPLACALVRAELALRQAAK